MDRIALLIRREEEFLLLNKESDGEAWSSITRQIEKGETLREAARSKTREVTGVEIEFTEKITKTEIGSGNERIHWYVAGEKSPTEEEPEPATVEASEEHIEWFRTEEIETLQLDRHTETFFQEHKEKVLAD